MLVNSQGGLGNHNQFIDFGGSHRQAKALLGPGGHALHAHVALPGDHGNRGDRQYQELSHGGDDFSQGDYHDIHEEYHESGHEEYHDSGHEEYHESGHEEYHDSGNIHHESAKHEQHCTIVQEEQCTQLTEQHCTETQRQTCLDVPVSSSILDVS